jgi:uncharacterized protein YjbI with pentapeptide repeats
MQGRLRRCGVLGALALLLAAPAHSATSGTDVRAASLATGLRAGRTIVLAHAIVSGKLDLRADVVHGAFKCRECTFEGPIAASDAIFDRTIDLSGSTFASDIDFAGASFRGPALFRSSPRSDLEFRGSADFSVAVFEDIASYSYASFDGPADFEDARFTEVTFASADFAAPATLDRAAFHGTAGFGAAEFEDTATFTDADFRERTDFGVATFDGGAVFSQAQFGQDASFLDAEFYAPAPAPDEDEQDAADFDGVVASGSLDFTFAKFRFDAPSGPARSSPRVSRTPRVIAIFDDTVCGRSLVFRKAEFADDERFAARLSMKRVQAADLVFDVDEAGRIGNPEDRQDILSEIEESAKTRGELGVANHAHYELLVLRSQRYGAATRVLDYVVYRGIAGYFVRPFRPLLILLVLATIFGVVRFLRPPAPNAAGTTPVSATKGRVDRARGQAGGLLTCILDSFALVLPRSGRSALTLGERFQTIAYRLLLVCALVGLANSNPTLRNMVDTLL